jgi:hypothetical protein
MDGTGMNEEGTSELEAEGEEVLPQNIDILG